MIEDPENRRIVAIIALLTLAILVVVYAAIFIQRRGFHLV